LTGSCSTDRDPSSFRRRRLLDGAAGGLLFLFGFALCLHHGRVGLMPLDQSIVFDGAWRLLCGQVPFRDFGTPAGLAPIALQALLFGAFGVSWFVYCLHAAIFNGLFCVLAFRLLRRPSTGPSAGSCSTPPSASPTWSSTPSSSLWRWFWRSSRPGPADRRPDGRG
jgi:hypothetical protein